MLARRIPSTSSRTKCRWRCSLPKFGSEILDYPSNLVWVPRLKHEQITAAYNSKIDDDPWGRRVRDVVSAEDYDAQFAVGLKTLRLAGVLQ